MTRALRAAGLAALVVLMSGCYNHLYTYGSGGNMNHPPKYDNAFVPHFIYGLVGEHQMDVKSICPSGNATVKDYTSFWNGLITALVGIVYAPKAIEVYCDQAAAAAAQSEMPEGSLSFR